MMDRAILHVDMDAFYASVEQRDHPEFRGRPVIVGADPKGGRGRGVVAACSYEARTFGVRSALPISQAWRLCPEGVYVRPRMNRYTEASREIMGVLRRFTDLVEPLSLDEAFLDVTGSRALFGTPSEIARTVKKQIREATGLAASAGAAPNKFIAKIASDIGKPDGLVIVEPGNAEAFLSPLPISRLWGVGPKTAERLRALGFDTIGQIRNAPPGALAPLGDLGEHLKQLSHGLDDRPVIPDREPKSIGNETTFEEDTRDRDLLIRTMRGLSEQVGRRLRRASYRARKIAIKVRYADFETHTRQTTAAKPVRTDEDIAQLAVDLLGHFPLDRKIRLIGVSAGDLMRESDDPAQLGLFSQAADPAKLDTLNDAVDRIREKFGDAALWRAGQQRDG
jgi:nucleotidyltransferase/DNA polymerase involved in DNA repair